MINLVNPPYQSLVIYFRLSLIMLSLVMELIGIFHIMNRRLYRFLAYRLLLFINTLNLLNSIPSAIFHQNTQNLSKIEQFIQGEFIKIGWLGENLTVCLLSFIMYSSLIGKLYINNKYLEILCYLLLISFSFAIEEIENPFQHFGPNGFYYFHKLLFLWTDVQHKVRYFRNFNFLMMIIGLVSFIISFLIMKKQKEIKDQNSHFLLKNFIEGIQFFPLFNFLIWFVNFIFKTILEHPKSANIPLQIMWVFGNCIDNLTGFVFGVVYFKIFFANQSERRKKRKLRQIGLNEDGSVSQGRLLSLQYFQDLKTQQQIYLRSHSL